MHFYDMLGNYTFFKNHRGCGFGCTNSLVQRKYRRGRRFYYAALHFTEWPRDSRGRRPRPLAQVLITGCNEFTGFWFPLLSSSTAFGVRQDPRGLNRVFSSFKRVSFRQKRFGISFYPATVCRCIENPVNCMERSRCT